MYYRYDPTLVNLLFPTGGALEYLRTTMFTSANGDRSNVPNIGVVLSDGVSNDASYTATQAANARNAGITLFSIGIGSGIPMSELNEIATDPDSDHVFAVSSFSALDSIKSSFQAQACPAGLLDLYSALSYLALHVKFINDSYFGPYMALHVKPINDPYFGPYLALHVKIHKRPIFWTIYGFARQTPKGTII